MALDVVFSPGCAGIVKDELADMTQGGGVLIDTGLIAQSLGWNPTDPNRNDALLGVAVGMRTTAIKIAREENLHGVVRTSNASPEALAKLSALTGGSVRSIPLTRAEACRRIRKLLPNNRDRQMLCEEGLDRYYKNAT